MTSHSSHLPLSSLSIACRTPGLTHLQELDLQGCDSVTGTGLTHLSASTSLRSLNLNQCTKLATGLAALSGVRVGQQGHLKRTKLQHFFDHQMSFSSTQTCHLWYPEYS
jgi:hypothetical protein